MLSPEGSAEPGRWNTDRNPIARGVLDSIQEPGVREIVIMSSSQLLKTEVLLNVIGYFSRLDPCPMLLLQPTVDMAQSFSKERLAPMIRDSPTLASLYGDPKSRSSDTTILKKLFPGGYVQLQGANSPAGLAMRAVRVLLCDEVDRYPLSAGREGDPVSIAQARQETFWNSLLIMTSSPTEKGVSRIERAYEASDRRRCYVTCVHCRAPQYLVWSHVQWPKGEPKKALLHCEECGAAWNEPARQAMLARHEWRPTDTATVEGRIGFWASKLYSPWKQPHQLAVDFMEKKKDHETLKTFVNTTLGESWEHPGDVVPFAMLYARREVYPPGKVPNGSVLTAGVDVQDDRVEGEIVSWGAGEESWSVQYFRLYGDPGRRELWQALAEMLSGDFYRVDGEPMHVRLACIDSGGHYTDEVYSFCRRAPRRYIPTKGHAVPGKPITEFPRAPNKQKVYLTMIGTDTAKELLYNRLNLTDPGTGYCHFPMADDYDEEYFKQLTAEKREPRHRHGHLFYVWTAMRKRNEALDCRLGAHAALRILERHSRVIPVTIDPGKSAKPPPRTAEEPQATPDNGRQAPRRRPPRGRSPLY